MMPTVVPDAIDNISQRYIEHLRERRQRADEAYQKARGKKAANQLALTEAEEWKTLVREYWTRLLETDDKYDKLDITIQRLTELARVTTQNVHELSQAVETLVCIVREASAKTDALSQKVTRLRNRLSAVTNKNNGYLKLIAEMEAKVLEAATTNETAIKAVLDLLKDCYELHVQLEGRILAEKIRIRLEDPWTSIEVGDEESMEFYHKFLIVEYLRDHYHGLEAHLEKLKELLEQNRAYPLADLSPQEREALPFRLDEDADVPTFPLPEQPYYENTEKQFEDARKRVKRARKRSQRTDSRYASAEARFKALDAALKAAGDAKVATGGQLVNGRS
jgi:chromosome segregation ATPase